MNAVSMLNTAWMWKCSRALRDFHRESCDVEAAQDAVLRRIIRKNQDCEFGRRYGFRAIQAASDFQCHVPLSTYEDYGEPVSRIAAGSRGVLTSEPVTRFMPTSGSSGAEKLIPYTSALRAEFQRAINAWIADLLRHRPAVRRGRSYWSISPAFGDRQPTAAGIPIGFEDDTQYLGLIERQFLRRLLAVPPDVARLSSIENFRYATLLHLVRSADLSLVSIWSPTFLPTMLRSLDAWSDQIVRDLETGGLSLPDATGRTELRAGRNLRRADEVRSIFANSTSDVERYQQLWPRLALISCWTDAAAARQAAQLQQMFPQVELQSKGLLATECAVSFPLVGHDAPALAIRSHFFEFQPLVDGREPNYDNDDDCRLAHELEVGGRYAVVVTTGGGLYRYQLNDVVEVVGHANQCPLIRFVGRTNQTSDMVGEKLSEPFVRECLDAALAAHDLSPSFAMVVPVESPQPHYRLYLQDRGCEADDSRASALAADLQQLLERNPHYRYAVELGQLTKLCVRIIPHGPKTAWEVFETTSANTTRHLGDIKPTALDAWPGWASVFEELIASGSGGLRTSC